MADKSRQSKSSKYVVAAMDFGTTYSGYAYSFKAEWLRVNTNRWPGGEQIPYKAPSALLLNPDESFNSFGFEAENTYASLIADDDEECQKYLFFRRFQMILMTAMQRRVHRKTQCIAENGKSVDSMKVFTNCINYMKNHLLEKLRDKIQGGISVDDIDFVLTVPAIWDDTAKMLMYEAAEKAWIKRDQLHIALEPEAASIYCQLMHLESEDNSRLFLAGKEYDAKYMVLDLGGGTADFTVHKLTRDGSLTELVPATGGPWGGACVDQAFHDVLVELFGEDVMRRFRMDPEYIEDYFEFWQNFESKKRSFETSKKGSFFVRFPVTLPEIVRGKTNESRRGIRSDIIIQDVIKQSRFKDDLKYEHGKLQMNYSFFKQMIDPTVNLLTDHLTKLYKYIGGDLKVILMVGGFSECSFVQEAVKETFQDKCKVVVPNQAGLAVLKGAVYLGHQPHLISERVARYTYGIQTWSKFDETVHMQSKLVKIGDEKRCKDVFFRFVTKGERIKLGEKKSYMFEPLNSEERQLEYGIFFSTEENPQYVDEMGCVKLGILFVSLQSDRVHEKLEIEVSFIFGHTELHVAAFNCQTKTEHKVTFDLLSPNINFPEK